VASLREKVRRCAKVIMVAEGDHAK